LRRNLLARYFSKQVKEKLNLQIEHVQSRAEMTLHEVQVYLDREGASDLVAELVMKSITLSPNVFMEAVQLGIALLEGGNPVIQQSLFTKLQSSETNTSVFFKVFYDKMREAQAEIRSTMSLVNTFDNMASSSSGKESETANSKITLEHKRLPHKLDDTADEISTTSDKSESKLSSKVLLMQPVFRFLQLLCENHNGDLQVNFYKRFIIFKLRKKQAILKKI